MQKPSPPSPGVPSGYASTSSVSTLLEGMQLRMTRHYSLSLRSEVGGELG